MIQVVDLAVAHLSADDEVVFQVDEVDDDEVEEVGNILFNNNIKKWKNSDYLF